MDCSICDCPRIVRLGRHQKLIFHAVANRGRAGVSARPPKLCIKGEAILMKKNCIQRVQAFLLALVLICSLAVPVAMAEGEISLNHTAAAMEIGDTLTLTADVADMLASAGISWKSNNPAVAAVQGSGAACTVTAEAPGAATITASITTDGGATHQATCAITVTEPAVPVSRVEISTAAMLNTVEKNDTLQLEAVVYPTDATNQAVSWSSSNPDVASVDADGTVTGAAPGKTVITAKTEDGGFTATREVECSGIALSKTSMTLLVNESESLSFPCYGAASGKNVVWSSSNPSVADAAAGRITGHYPGTATVTAVVYGTGYAASCTVVVEEDVADAVNCTVQSGQFCGFDGLLSTLNSRSREKTGAGLDYLISLSVPTSQGILYHGYVSPDAHGHGVGGTEKYYYRAGASQMSLSEVSFVPRTDFSGTAVISYMGYATNGKSFSGTIRVEVENAGDVSYSTASNRPLEFTAEEFTAICQARTGRSVKYILFEQPSASRGTLYYQYSSTGQFSQRVDGNTKYYTTSTPSVNAVTFVPAESYTGTVTVPYTCVDSAGGSYSGKVTITVYSASGTGRGDVEYTAGVGEKVRLDSSDFNDVCREVQGTSLNYVYFDLPSSREGTLYYDYTSKNDYGGRVSDTTRYYRNSSPRISQITFVPADGFSGTVTISYTGYDTAGESFTGNVIIRLADEDGTVYYSTGAGKPLQFEAADFNEACLRSNGASLSRLSFDLPASSRGGLYYDYTSSSGGSRVSSSTSYYRSGTPQLSKVTFVPKSGYTGTVSIPFSGYDVDGSRFTGSVRISVGTPGDGIVKYHTVSGGSVHFNAADFNTACREITGDSLSYVRFTPPASRSGTLYDQYSGLQGSAVTSFTNYYRSGSSRLLDGVSFLAVPGYTGMVSINYTGRSSGGATFSGVVEIQVYAAGGPPTIDGYLPFRDISSSAYYFDAVKWAVNTGITSGTTATTFSPDAACTRAQMVTFLWRAAGSPAPRSSVNPFRDINSGAYYYQAVLWAVEQGITSGTSSTTFSPDAIITRGQTVMFLYRNAGSPASGTGSAFDDVKIGDYYSSAVRWAVANGITSGTSATTFSPSASCTRAQIVTFLYRTFAGW